MLKPTRKPDPPPNRCKVAQNLAVPRTRLATTNAQHTTSNIHIESSILPGRPTDLQSVQLQVGDADGSHGRDWSRLGA